MDLTNLKTKNNRQPGPVIFPDHFLQKISTLFPAMIMGALLLTHYLVSNNRSFLQEQFFSTALQLFLTTYLILLVISRFSAPLKQGLTSKTPILTALLIALLIWELATLKFNLLPLPFFPSPGAILAVLVSDWSTLLVSALYSLRLLFSGYLLGLLVGIPTGVLMGWSPRFNYWLTPLLRFIGPIPATAWIPIVMVIFPTSFIASIFLIALSSWFPITVMTWSGISNVNKSYYEMARTLGADETYLITKVALPAAMPSIFVGLFMGLGTAFVTLVVGEMLGVRAGLGWYIQWAQGWGEYVKVYAALIIMAILFSSITLLFKFKDKVLVWQKGLIKW